MPGNPNNPDWHMGALLRLRTNIDYLDHRNFGAHLDWDHDTRLDELMGDLPPVHNPAQLDRALRPPVPNDPMDLRNYARERLPFHLLGRTDDGNGQFEDRAFVEALQGDATVGLRFERVLGAGSQGLAMLFSLTETGEKLVVKTSTGYGSMVAEMWAMRHLVGARHIVQRRYIPGLGDKGVSDLPENMINQILTGMVDLDQLANNSTLDLDESPYLFYCMEFARHGTLNGILIKSSLQQYRMKSKDLWRIFYCLFRGCVGLAYPDNWDQNLDPETAAQPIPTQEEAIPLGPDGLPRDSTTGVLDLDMNDRNIMIGDYDFDDRAGGHEHAEIPVFKIGDLGIARAFRTPYWQRHAEARLYNMACGNPACSTPESFSEGWKNVGDWDSYDREETAGKFSWKTNLWQAAQLMNIVITQSFPDIPPNSYPAPITKPDGEQIQIWTCGSHLIYDPAFTHIDQSFRELVAWCLAHRPGDRPEMLELEAIFRAAMDRDIPDDDNNDNNSHPRETISNILQSPPPPRPRLWTAFPFPSDDQEARREARRAWLDVVPPAANGMLSGFPFPLGGGVDGEERREALRRMLDSTPAINSTLWTNFAVPDGDDNN